jgi:hypothetical protein
MGDVAVLAGAGVARLLGHQGSPRGSSARRSQCRIGGVPVGGCDGQGEIRAETRGHCRSHERAATSASWRRRSASASAWRTARAAAPRPDLYRRQCRSDERAPRVRPRTRIHGIASARGTALVIDPRLGKTGLGGPRRGALLAALSRAGGVAEEMPVDNEGRSASAVASQPEPGPPRLLRRRWFDRTAWCLQLHNPSAPWDLGDPRRDCRAGLVDLDGVRRGTSLTPSRSG